MSISQFQYIIIEDLLRWIKWIFIGLETIHNLTQSGRFEVKVDLMDFNNEKTYSLDRWVKWDMKRVQMCLPFFNPDLFKEIFDRKRWTKLYSGSFWHGYRQSDRKRIHFQQRFHVLDSRSSEHNQRGKLWRTSQRGLVVRGWVSRLQGFKFERDLLPRRRVTQGKVLRRDLLGFLEGSSTGWKRLFTPGNGDKNQKIYEKMSYYWLINYYKLFSLHWVIQLTQYFLRIFIRL